MKVKSKSCRTETTTGTGETLQTDGGLLPAVFGFALASGQAALQLLGHALVAVPAHRPQVNFNKLISELPQAQQVKHVRKERRRGKKEKRKRQRGKGGLEKHEIEHRGVVFRKR